MARFLHLWRRPFYICDEIRNRDYEGRVEAINVRATVLRTYNSERLIVPNSDVYTSTVLVKTACISRRSRITVGVGCLDDLEQARSILQQVVQATEGVLHEPGPWVHVIELAPSEVKFGVYFWTNPAQSSVLAVTDRVITAVKKALDAAGIDMPYPHRVVLFHDATGSRAGDVTRHADCGAEDSPNPQS